MRRRRVLLAALLVGAASAEAADFSTGARGTTAADFLTISVGARATAMGGAFGAAADDATAVYWNPASITEVEKRSLVLMHANYVASSYFEYLGYVHNAEKYGFAGFSLQYFSAGTLTQTDAAGNVLGTISPYDMALTFTYARRLKSGPFAGWSLGASARQIDSKILNSASAGAFDLGVLTPWYWDGRMRLSLTASNWGGDTLVYQQVAERIPGLFRVGSAWLLSPDWLTTLDLDAPENDRVYVAAGTEYWFARTAGWNFAGRVGVNSQTIGTIDGFTGVSMGFGVASKHTSFDYAFVPVGGLGQAHRLSLGLKF